ncbi:MAG: NBR1-Ig-like domain-containing protein [Chloroflexi bacterium]|nr:NBR1-Ig-like domain-containing protein [Chloroflexota bacterium]
MKHKIYVVFSICAALTLFLSACGAETQPTPDAAAISTSAAQTVEARFTLQAALQATETPAPPAETPMPAATSTLGYPPTQTTAPGLPSPTSNGKPCYAMTFVSDVSIPDGMIMAPGAKFTKTWRVRNDGNCVWDPSYTLELAMGDAMSTVTKIPLTKTVYPDDSIDFSVDMVAPDTNGTYAGYWHVATPYGGYMGVGSYNQNLVVKIQVTTKPDLAFGAVSVAYDYTRRPEKGCTSAGAYYDFSATITANGPGEFQYRWDRNPFDGKVEGGVLKFAAAGSKTVYFTWHMTADHLQDIDRWVGITTVVDSKETRFDRIMFRYTCAP